MDGMDKLQLFEKTAPAPPLNDEKIKEALDEIKWPWVELSDDIPLDNHRLLITYSRELQIMILT